MGLESSCSLLPVQICSCPSGEPDCAKYQKMKKKYKKKKQKILKKKRKKNSLDEHSDKTRLESWLLGPRQTAPFTSLASVSHD